jgi:hypothetical protein
MRRRNGSTLLPKLPLLITESADEFDALRDAFEREIKPRGIIEQMYVVDIHRLGDPASAAVQGDNHQFSFSQGIGKSSRAAFKAGKRRSI